MEKKLIIERMQATIEKMKLLKPEEFDFSLYVKKFDKEKNCGTVCCVAGYYPMWFPEAKLEWCFNEDWGNVDLKSKFEEETQESVIDRLMLFHGVDEDCIRALFYGYSQHVINERDLDNSASIGQVINLWERILWRIKNNDLSLFNED